MGGRLARVGHHGKLGLRWQPCIAQRPARRCEFLPRHFLPWHSYGRSKRGVDFYGVIGKSSSQADHNKVSCCDHEGRQIEYCTAHTFVPKRLITQVTLQSAKQ